MPRLLSARRSYPQYLNYICKLHVRVLLLLQINPQRVDCPVCGNGFKCLYNLARHQRNAHSTGQYICEVCGVRNTRHCLLRRHMALVHRKERVAATVAAPNPQLDIEREELNLLQTVLLLFTKLFIIVKSLFFNT